MQHNPNHHRCNSSKENTMKYQGDTMTPRERWLATAEFKSVDRTFLLPPWPWGETVTRWKKEGLCAGPATFGPHSPRTGLGVLTA